MAMPAIGTMVMFNGGYYTVPAIVTMTAASWQPFMLDVWGVSQPDDNTAWITVFDSVGNPSGTYAAQVTQGTGTGPGQITPVVAG